MAVSGAVLHTKITDACTIKKRWLKGLLSHSGHPMHTKISEKFIIKIRCLGTPRSNFVVAGAVLHAKIISEYNTKTRCLKGHMRTRRTSYAYKDKC